MLATIGVALGFLAREPNITTGGAAQVLPLAMAAALVLAGAGHVRRHRESSS